MKRINILDVDTSNKIAAGEVVERPASVVKELVENSIDAKAKNISIEILDGGQKTIKVIDDGSGIHPEDIEKAFLPHATSKIMTIDDINTIGTLGFRGEALASIAAVSNVMLKSRVEEYDYGMEISMSGGRMNYFKETGCNIGTSIEVNDLFYNVPARQKFLKSPQREAAYISDLIEKLALCNSDVSFKYSSNGKNMITTFGNGKLIDAIRSIYGKEIQGNLNEFEKHSDIASVYGYIGSSEISKGSRNDQSIFVNKRFIKSKLITTAVEQAFKSFLTINKFPFFILFLDIFPELIDVNVHPTKTEIKFKDDREIFKLVFDSVHEALRKSLRQSFNTCDAYTEEVHQLPMDLKSNNSIAEELKYSNNNDLVKEEAPSFHPALEKRDEREGTSAVTAKVNQSQESKPEENAKFEDLNVIGQFNGTYILAEGQDGLYIIDQHAAHEKILFEKYTKQINRRELVAQLLATPVVMELSSEDFTYYVENIDIFKNTGFNIDIFGENTISIREVPIILGKPDLRNLFSEIISNLKDMGSGEAAEVKYNKIATLACKSAVKAKDLLSYLEMKALIQDLRYIDDPFTCPHGRPTIIKMTVNELEKKFKRIQ